MAMIQSAEESARMVLAIFGQFDIGPDEILQFASLHPAFLEKGGRATDFQPGINWLVERGYIEAPTDSSPIHAFHLTRDGFEQLP